MAPTLHATGYSNMVNKEKSMKINVQAYQSELCTIKVGIQVSKQRRRLLKRQKTLIEREKLKITRTNCPYQREGGRELTISVWPYKC